MHGPITALRVLTHGFEVPLDPERSELRIGRASPPLVDVQLPLASISGLHALLTRDDHSLKVTDQGSKNGIGYAHGWSPGGYVRSTSLLVNTGDRFALGGVGLLALDAQTHQIVQPLAAYCGPGAHDEVDDALEAVIRGHMLIVCGSRADELHELSRMLHDHSVRRDFPFTKLDAIPDSDEAIDELCTRAGCGTIFLDLTKPFPVPLRFARNLFSQHFHLWTIVVAPTLDQAVTCLGNACNEPRLVGFHICELGFSRHQWHQRMRSVSFTKL
jgi:hypothetical protein